MNDNTLSNIDDRQRGMTLIELLAAILIAAMLTGWGVGQWRYHQQALRLEHTASTAAGVSAALAGGRQLA
jgi:prepilin-type N-terminal cleavage/methylation domain